MPTVCLILADENSFKGSLSFFLNGDTSLAREVATSSLESLVTIFIFQRVRSRTPLVRQADHPSQGCVASTFQYLWSGADHLLSFDIRSIANAIRKEYGKSEDGAPLLKLGLGLDMMHGCDESPLMHLEPPHRYMGTCEQED
ncbi:unnamed protein product [Prunus brigantina]